MNRVKNPFCLDPEDTSCPRLKSIGMKWNPTTGNLEFDSTEPTTPVSSIPNEMKIPGDVHLLDRLDKRGKNEDILEKTEKLTTSLLRFYKSRSPTYLKSIPPEISAIYNAISTPERFVAENRGWEIFDTSKELGLSVLFNKEEKLVYVNYSGFDGRTPWLKNVLSIFFGKGIETSEDIVKNRLYLLDLYKELPEGWKVQYNGHSYGGYKARYFASLFDTDSVLLNSHHMPWSKFPEGGRHQVHTIITDPVDFKHLFGTKIGNESHFYYGPKTENLSKSFVDGHFMHQFDARKLRANFLASYHEHIGILGTLAIGLGVGQSVYDMTKNKDPTNDMAMMGAAFDPAGLIVDPDYQYNDSTPPPFGIDWGIYQALQPVKSTILDNTPWGKERKREEQEIRDMNEIEQMHQGYLHQQELLARGETYKPPSQLEYVNEGGKWYSSTDGTVYTEMSQEQITNLNEGIFREATESMAEVKQQMTTERPGILPEMAN